jgi:hypothetical protein
VPNRATCVGAERWEGWLAMHGQSSGPQDHSRRRLQRAVVLELLSVEGEEGLSTAELGHALGVEAGELSGTLSELGVAGVLEISQGSVRASAATRRLDELELIGI